MYTVRQVKRKSNEVIASCGSQNGKVFVFLKSPNSSGNNQKVFINCMKHLDEICLRELGASSSSICNEVRNN